MNPEEQHVEDWKSTKANCEELLLNIDDEVLKGHLISRIKACDRLLPKNK